MISGPGAGPATACNEELHARVMDVCARAKQYLLTRQGPDGGFCVYRSQYVDDANLGDTASAIHALTLLSHPVPSPERVVAFLSTFIGSKQPIHLLHLLETWRVLRPNEWLDALLLEGVMALTLPTFPGMDVQQTGWLERTRAVLLLKRLVGDEQTIARAAAFVRSLADGGAFGMTPNLWDTWLALDILSLGGRINEVGEQSRSFVDLLQCLPAGFTLTPRSRVATLSTVFAGVECCRLLNLPLRYPEEMLRFIVGCQGQRGGFAQSPGSLPDIELTDRAISVLLSVCSRHGETFRSV